MRICVGFMVKTLSVYTLKHSVTLFVTGALEMYNNYDVSRIQVKSA
jgi:hypothetical protein